MNFQTFFWGEGLRSRETLKCLLRGRVVNGISFIQLCLGKLMPGPKHRSENKVHMILPSHRSQSVQLSTQTATAYCDKYQGGETQAVQGHRGAAPDQTCGVKEASEMKQCLS